MDTCANNNKAEIMLGTISNVVRSQTLSN